MKNRILIALVSLSLLGAASCSSSPDEQDSENLTPTASADPVVSVDSSAAIDDDSVPAPMPEPTPKPQPKPGTSSILEAADEGDDTPIQNGVAPAFQKLQEKLSQLGYEGIGLDYETEETLALLLRVFSDPALVNRRIKGVYTGGAMDYDPAPESLTISNTNDFKTIIAFIKKKVPSNLVTKTPIAPAPKTKSIPAAKPKPKPKKVPAQKKK